MDLTHHVEELSTQLVLAARPAEAQDLADRLVMAVEPALRLVLLDVLTEAAAEVSTELAPASIEVRLRGRDPELVVTPAPGAPLGSSPDFEPTNLSSASPLPGGESDDSATARVTLRLPESLKQRIDDAATRSGLSVNAWLVRTIGDSLDPPDARPSSQRINWGGQQFTGWAR